MFYKFIRKRKVFASLIPAAVLLLFGLCTAPLHAQVVKQFTKRTGSPAPANGTYRIKGNFTMMGNTNLTRTDYPGNDPNGGNSSSNMRFVDQDADTSTWNSSMSQLQLPISAQSNPDCTHILFAGLYWTGRSSTGNQYNATANRTLTYTAPVNFDSTNDYTGSSDQAAGTDRNINFSNYSVNIAQNGNGNSNSNNANAYYYSYTFSSTQPGAPTVRFEYRVNINNNGTTGSFPTGITNYVRYQINGGAWVYPTNQVLSGTGNNRTITFDPITIYTNGNAQTISVNKLVRDRRTNNGSSTSAVVTVRRVGTANITFTQNQNKTFDKRQIRFKKEGQPYVTYTASNNNIYYDGSAGETYGSIFSGFVDVTSYVQTNGVGNYWAADMALVSGNGGSTGYFGCWSLIVVYENAGEKWRDVMIFDGHAFVNGNITANYTLPVSGFQAAQNGPVNVRMGIMAGEGDRDIEGDYLQIQQKNTNNYTTLSHSGNTTNNFFNSSIVTGGNNRNPNFTNNTGIDIAMFDLDNTNNNIIGNSQTATNLKYGSTQDLYSISVIALGIDAYVPDVAGVSAVSSVSSPSNPVGDSVVPGEILEYTTNIYNNGTEAIIGADINIPLPYTVEYVPGSGSVQYFYTPAGSQPVISSPEPPQSLNIDFGNIPLPTAANPNSLMAVITYKVKVTEDCRILTTPPDCSPRVEANGYISGAGQFSGEPFSNLPFILGYDSTTQCSGSPIPGPLNNVIKVGQQWLDDHNCSSETSRDFTFCNPPGTNIPFATISSNFPNGSQYYNQSQTVQYTESTGFPIVNGTVNFVAVPPGEATCDYPFTITITTNNNTPTPNPANVTYCLNATASPLNATPQSSGNTLYYYTQQTGGIPVLQLAPPTNTVGTTQYWVAEGPGVECVGPRALITVNVIPLPDAGITLTGAGTVCEGSTAPTITITNPTNTPISVTYDVNGSNQQTVSLAANASVNVPASTTTPGTFTYNLVSTSLQGADACTVQLSANVSYLVNPKPNGSLSITTPICEGENGVLTFIATSGTGPFTLIINGQSYDNISSGSSFNITPMPTTSEDYNLTQITDANTCANP